MVAESSIKQEFIQKLRDIVEANLSDENFGVNELAKVSGLNYFSLNRRLRSVIRKTTSQFICEIRLEKAKEILEQEDHLTASEVAYRVGFGSPAYFNRCFHEHFGYPPGEIKKRGSTDHKETGNETSLTSQKEEESPNNLQEQKPNGEKLNRKGVILASAGMLILAILASFYFFHIFNQSLPGLNPQDKSIAVLPFKNLSNDNENQYFADGVMEDILNLLSRIREFKVVPRTSVEQFRGSTKSAPEIARTLGVNFILEGSVQRYEDKVRVNVQLIDVRHDRQIHSEKYDREFADIFTIQSSIAKQVADQLQAALSPNEIKEIEKLPTTNMEAYSHYLKGRYFLNKRKKEEFNIILECFQKAIAADPGYAEAYAGMAEAYGLYTSMRWYPSPEGFIKAKEFAQKALDLNQNLAEAHAIIGEVLCSEWKWEEAKKEFDVAIGLNPNSSTAHQYYADLLATINQKKEARVHYDIAAKLNPISPNLYIGSIDLYIDEQQYEKALADCQKIVDLDPRFYSVYHRYYRIYTEMGEDLKAVEAVQKVFNLFPEVEKYIPVIKEIYDREGLEGVKKWQLELHLKNAVNDVNKTMAVARSYATLGDKEKALDYLEMAYKNRTIGLPGQMFDSRFEGLLNEQRFQALLDSMNLTPYQIGEVNPDSQNKVRK